MGKLGFLAAFLSISLQGGISQEARGKKGDREASIAKAIKYILDNQKNNGLWAAQEGYHKEYKSFKTCPECEPNSWDVAATALCMYALMEHQDIEPYRQVIALEKGLKAMISGITKARTSRCCTHSVIPWDSKVWIPHYCLLTLARAYNHSLFKDRKKWIQQTINELTHDMEDWQTKDVGGWSYARVRGGGYTSISFVNALNILAFEEMKRYKIKFSSDCYKSTVKALKDMKKSQGNFVYGTGVVTKADSVPGSCGRTPLCELALYVANESSQENLEKAIELFFKYRDELEKVRKTTSKRGGHEGKYLIAPYYFYFGHYYTALCAYYLKDHEARAKHISKIQDIFMELQEEDGSFAGYDLWDRSYKAALGVLVLTMLNKKVC